MGATLVINASGVETRVALVENGTISEYYLERKKDKGIVGNIYKGKVVRVLPGMQAAFVDIGLDKAAFLYVNDVFYDPDFSEQQFELTEGEHAEYDDPSEHEEGCQCSDCVGSDDDATPANDGDADGDKLTIAVPGLKAEGEPESAAEGESGERRGEIRAGHGRRNRRGRGAHREGRVADDKAAASTDEARTPDSAASATDNASTAEAASAAEEAPVVAGEEATAVADLKAPAEKPEDGKSAEAAAAEAADASPAVAAEAPSTEAPAEPAEPAAGADASASAAEKPANESAAEPAAEATDGAKDDAAPSAAAGDATPVAEAAKAVDAASAGEEAPEAPAEGEKTPSADRPRDQQKGRNHRNERGHKGGKDKGGKDKGDDDKSDAGRQGGAKQRRPAANIQDLLKVGQEIIVQVAKDPIGTKGARVTSHISIPGRQIVFMPTVDHVGISRRIEKESERRRLRDIVERIRPAGTGFIVRTVAENISTEKLEADARFLTGIWSEVVAKKDKIGAPALLHPDLDLTLRATRDLFVQDVEKLVIDDRAEWERISRFVAAQAPALKDRVVLHEGDEPIFDAYGIEHELQRAYSRKVWLKSGGYLIIDQAEALTAIDVNSGRYVGKKSLEETITKINIEAAKEIVYQLRLRNIGGIMIIDFIDMAKAQNRDKVFKALQEALGHDKARTNILKISELGLIEMTRKRVRESVGRTMNEPCPYCEGRGFLKSRTTVAYDILRQIRREANNFGDCSIHVNCNADVAHLLQYDERDELRYLMDRFNKSIHIHPQPGYHQEQYEVYGKMDRQQRGKGGDQRRGGNGNGGGQRRNGNGGEKPEEQKLSTPSAALKPPEASGELKPASAPLEAPQGKLSEYK